MRGEETTSGKEREIQRWRHAYTRVCERERADGLRTPVRERETILRFLPLSLQPRLTELKGPNPIVEWFSSARDAFRVTCFASSRHWPMIHERCGKIGGGYTADQSLIPLHQHPTPWVLDDWLFSRMRSLKFHPSSSRECCCARQSHVSPVV